MRRHGTVGLILAASLAGALGACGDPPDEEDGEEAGPEAAVQTDAEVALASGSLDDGDIEALLALVNGSEVGGARAVQPKLVFPATRAYAQMLIDDHTALRAATPQVEGDGRPPAQFGTMRAITHAQSGMFATLPAGPSFDVFFTMAQAGTHAMVLDSLHHWHRAASDPELRSSLATAIQVVEKHLGAAQALSVELDAAMAAGRIPDTLPPTRVAAPAPGDTLPPPSVPSAPSAAPDTASGGG